MYNEHFGLSQSPFRITPDTGLFFTGAGRGEVLEALVYAITSGEGIIKVTGEVGTGKTMLCRMLESRLPANVDLVYLANPSLSPNDIVQAIALELGVLPDTSGNRIELVFQLQQTLVQRHAENHRVVVLIEEAQSMPTETLEEVRLLSNLETKREKLLQIVLFGQPELDEKLSRSEIRQLRERITHSFQLSPLVADEVRDYVNFRLRASGYRGRDAFTTDAFRVMGRAAEGLTRRVNILADKALLAAYAEDTHDVARRHVNTAIKDSAFQRARRRPAFSAVAVLVVALAAAGIGWFGARWLSGAGMPGMMIADATQPVAPGSVQPAAGRQARLDDAATAFADAAPPVQAAGAAPVQAAGAAPVQAAGAAPVQAAGAASVQAAGAAPGPSGGAEMGVANVGIIPSAMADVPRPDAPPDAGPVSRAKHDTASSVVLEKAPSRLHETGAAAGGEAADRRGTQSRIVDSGPQESELMPQPLVRTLIAALSQGDRQMMAPPPSAEPLESGAPRAAATAPVQAAGAAPVQAAGAALVQAAGAAPVQAAGAAPVQAAGAAPVQAAGAAPVQAAGAALVQRDAPGPFAGASRSDQADAAQVLPSGDLLEQRLQMTANWLDDINPGHYTIQLLATVAAERDSLLQFLDRQGRGIGLESVYVYQTSIGGRSWYSVVFGNFASFSEARDALQGLPRELARHSPFIRNLSDLRTRSG